MKFKSLIFTAVLLTVFIPFTASAEDTVFDCASAAFTQKGGFTKSDAVGYGLTAALCADSGKNASAVWKIPNSAGTVFKLYFWKTLSEDGSPGVTINYSSETYEITKRLRLDRGVAGWEEIGIASLSGAGATVTVTAESGKLYLSAIKTVPLGREYLSLAPVLRSDPDSLILQTNNLTAFAGGALSQMPDTPPIVEEGRTFVPLRFITEAMGAEVIWREADNEAEVKFKTQTFIFGGQRDYYILNGENKPLPFPLMMLNGRLLLPIRLVSEEIGKQVFWDESGLIVIGGEVKLDSDRDKKTIADILEILN